MKRPPLSAPSARSAPDDVRPARRALTRAIVGLGMVPGLGAGFTLLRPAAARAQGTPLGAWPARSVRIVVPFPPGGTTDHVTRLVATELARAWSQSVVVENKPGAGTVIGVDQIAKAPPDGHHLVTVANSFAVNHTLVRKLPYDTLRDLRPVALLSRSDHVLVAHPGVGARDAREFVALARARRGRYSFASFGNGTSAHLAGEMLNASAGLDLAHVPYKGQAPALADVMGGQVPVMFANLPEVLPQIQAGRLRALGLAALARSRLLPELPTLAEQGVGEIESNTWSGILAPARTPDEIVTRVHADLQKALDQPAVRRAFEDGGIVALPGSTEAFGRFLRTEIDRYAAVLRRIDLTQD